MHKEIQEHERPNEALPSGDELDLYYTRMIGILASSCERVLTLSELKVRRH